MDTTRFRTDRDTKLSNAIKSLQSSEKLKEQNRTKSCVADREEDKNVTV